MTVPQHRLVRERRAMARREEWARRTTHRPKCRAMPNASGTHPLPARALSGEELWQQEGRMPHCLKEGALFLISIPRALSPERNKALAPHWSEHMAALQHSRGTLVAETLGGRELLLRGKKGFQKKELILSCRKDAHISTL